MLCPYCVNEVDSFEKLVDPIHGAITYLCPKCPKEAQHEIPLKYVNADAQRPNVMVSLVGKTGHGKTCFLSSLLQHLDNASKDWKAFSYQALDEIEFARVRAALEQLGRGDLPTGTSTTERPRPLLLELRDVPLVGGCHLSLYDVGGAVFNQVASVHDIARFVVRGATVIWLLSITDLDSAFELDEFLAVYLNSLEKLSCDPSRQSLILVLTKGDRLLTQPDLPESVQGALSSEIDPSKDGWAKLQALSDDIESWLGGPRRYANFVRRVRGEFRHVRYCVISALGSSPSDENQMQWSVQPRGVLLPLWWALCDSLPKATVLNDNGGSSEFFSLEAAFAESMKSSVAKRITLEEGDYRLQRPLTFSRPVEVVGAGSDVTRLICNAKEFVVQADVATSHDALRFSKLTFEHQGSEAAHVFVVRSGKVSFSNCQFVGAKRDENLEIGGAGIRCERNSSVGFLKCVATHNQWFGIWADDGTRVQIKKCFGNENGRSGICLSGWVDADVSDCECCNNAKYGLEIRGRSQSRVFSCLCKSNGGSGIGYFDHATGRANTNVCRENSHDGILAQDTSSVDLSRNRCERNKHCGIRFAADSDGTADANTCDENGIYGIEIGADARPAITSAECRRNGKVGLIVRRGQFSLFRGARVGGWQSHDNGEYEFVDERDAWSRFFFGDRRSTVPSEAKRSVE